MSVTQSLIYNFFNILDASLDSMSIGPGEIQVQHNNFIEEVSTGKVERKISFEKIFKVLVFLGCLLFVLILILVIVMGFKQSDETETLKQCLPGHYKFPDCISK